MADIAGALAAALPLATGVAVPSGTAACELAGLSGDWLAGAPTGAVHAARARLTTMEMRADIERFMGSGSEQWLRA